MFFKVMSREMIKPSSPTPLHLRAYKISFLDQLASPDYIPIILFYPPPPPPLLTTENSSGNNAATTRDGTARFDTLKKALSETLTRFYPLAGRFNKEDSSVNCNDDGAEYLDVRVNANILSVVENPDVEFLCQLLPPCENGSRSDSESEVQLAVQVNRFDCGGVAVGIRISHKITDGVTLATFLKCWAAVARNGGSGEAVPLYPSYEAAVVLPAKASSSSSETKTLPAIPGVKAEGTKPKLTRRFVLNASAIAELKAKATKDDKVPSRVVAAIALFQKCLVSVFPEKLIILNIPVNLRGRIDPPLSDHTFGNITKSVVVASDDAELGLFAARLRAGFAYVDDEFARNQETYDCRAMGPLPESIREKEIAMWTMSSWCRFGLYEADFGWGKPIWVSSTFGVGSRLVILLDTQDGEGVEAMVSLEEQDMIAFQKCLESFLPPTCLAQRQTTH